MIKSVLSSLSSLDIHTKEVIKKSASSSLVKISGRIIGVGVSIFLGRTIGADGIGVINLSNRIVNLFMILCLLGMPQVLVKKVAIGHNRKDWQLIGNSMFSAYWINGLFSIIVSVLLILAAPWISNNIFNEPRLTIPLIIAFVVMTPQVFSRIFSSGLIGYRKIWQSSLVDQTLSIVIVGILLTLLWLFGYTITIIKVVTIYAIGRIGVTVSMLLYWKKLYKNPGKSKLVGRTLLKMALPLLIVYGTAAISSNVSTVMLGWLSNSKEVGLFTVSARLALLTSFFYRLPMLRFHLKLQRYLPKGRKMKWAGWFKRLQLV